MKASVIVITYNHERFIRQALDSVLAQQTSFDFEVIVSEDCSTDTTREIVIDYARRYPERIRTIFSESNVHSPWVVERAVREARGEYINLIDGDDYWTSPYKLQKQVEFMNSHPEFTLTWHACVYVDAEGNLCAQQPVPVTHAVWSLQEMLVQYPMETSAVMMRRELIADLPQWYRNGPAGDFALWAMCMQHGPAGYFDECLSAYRIHSESLGMKGRDEIGALAFWLRTYRDLYLHSPVECRNMMTRHLAKLWLAIALRQQWAGEAAASRMTAREALRDCPTDPKLLVLAYAPWLWKPARLFFRLLGGGVNVPQSEG